MFVRLLLLFTVVPLVELFLLIELGRLFGVLPTIALVLSTGVLGAWLARREGLRTLRAVQEQISQGRMPTEGLMDGLLILVAGAVLLTPGLLTDACGFFLLIPAGRGLVRTVMARAFRNRIQTGQPVVIDAEWERDGE